MCAPAMLYAFCGGPTVPRVQAARWRRHVPATAAAESCLSRLRQAFAWAHTHCCPRCSALQGALLWQQALLFPDLFRRLSIARVDAQTEQEGSVPMAPPCDMPGQKAAAQAAALDLEVCGSWKWPASAHTWQ